jgi:hydroxyethylthiazole kinase
MRMERPSGHLDAMRAAAPLVQNVTNYVAMNVMANVLLAAGASPAMVHARGEAGSMKNLGAGPAGVASPTCRPRPRPSGPA